MKYLADVLIIIILFFGLFGILHSILASNKIKKLIKDKAGEKIAFYRLFYNIVSLIAFLAFYNLAPKPSFTIYDLSYPYDLMVTALQIASLLGLYWAVKYVDVKEFLGLTQIKRYAAGNYNTEDLDEKSILTAKGPYAYSRHPIYFFSILFLLFRPTMDLFYFTMFICIVIYFFVGSFYEEKKLVERFGEEYRNYQRKVPRIIPLKLRGKS